VGPTPPAASLHDVWRLLEALRASVATGHAVGAAPECQIRPLCRALAAFGRMEPDTLARAEAVTAAAVGLAREALAGLSARPTATDGGPGSGYDSGYDE
jgi:hypothetical protein